MAVKKNSGSSASTMDSGSWLPEAKAAIALTRNWAKDVHKKTGCEVLLFGSSIYKSGEQFDGTRSDLDIVCLFPKSTDAKGRFEIVCKLKPLKLDLEVSMISALQRLSCSEAGVSIVAITEQELRTNVHKSGVRRFWDRNYFYDFSMGRARLLNEAGTQYIADEGRHAMEYVQKVRNDFLSVSANGTGGLAPYAGTDPLPKSLLRCAAQLNPIAQDGEWYDTMLGLELLLARVRDLRSQGSLFQQLADCVSVRCGARGHQRPLSAEHQLLLAEILLDEAINAGLEDAVTFYVRVVGGPFAPEDASEVFRLLARVAPGAKLTGTRHGSIILQISAPKSTMTLLEELEKHGALRLLLQADAAEVIPGTKAQEISSKGRASRKSILLSLVREWRPRGAGYAAEHEFMDFLSGMLASDKELEGGQVYREVAVDGVPSLRLDFLVSWRDPDGATERIAIEVTTARGPAQLFDKLTRFRVLGQPVMLVLIGGEKLVNEVAGDLARYAEVNANVDVLAVPAAQRPA